MKFSTLSGRSLLFIGAALLLLSMPLLAFSFNERGTDTLFGFQVWTVSIYPILGKNTGYKDPYTTAMVICALMNIPQLLYPLSSSAKAGTSQIWRIIFASVAYGLLPLLAIATLFMSASDQPHYVFIYREGFFVYQLGYIISALGFRRKFQELQLVTTNISVAENPSNT